MGRDMSGIVYVVAITLFAALPSVSSQVPARPPLDQAVVEAVEPLYPGFVEILEQDDPAGVGRLARILSDHPSPETLTVLLWMLRHCPSWPQDGVLQLEKAIRSVGRLPLAAVVDALRHASADHRIIAASLLGSHRTLVPDAEQPLLDAALIAALADPSERVREVAAGGLRGRDSADATAAIRE